MSAARPKSAPFGYFRISDIGHETVRGDQVSALALPMPESPIEHPMP
jgi:hypothetical protein